MPKTIGLALATLALLVFGTAPAWGEDSAATPTALGYSEGQALPPDSELFEEGTIRIYEVEARAGMSNIFVLGTKQQGVCKVIGWMDVLNPRGDIYGIRHKSTVDELAERVAVKLGRAHTEKTDWNAGDPDEWWPMVLWKGNTMYAYIWKEGDASPFRTVLAEARHGGARVIFEFLNFVGCLAEQTAEF